MDALYISTLVSERFVSEIFKKTGNNPGFAVQKFNRLIVKGLGSNGLAIKALSNPPVTSSFTNHWICRFHAEKELGVFYQYIPFVNFPIIRHLCIFIYTFFYALFWGLGNNKEKVIICDVLSTSICLAAVFASKINRVRSVGIVTDLFDLIVDGNNGRKQSLIKRSASKIQLLYRSLFSRYVLLTEAMNEIVNPHFRPYIVMEGLCDDSSVPYNNTTLSNNNVVLYAGGLEEEYGLKALVEGFRMIKRDDIKLVIYGSGSYEKEIIKICKDDKRIDYRGVAPTAEVIHAEVNATLLVNPRFTHADFAKYSFPSKNMEYMVSGTPLLTTRLPGIPKDYFPHLYFFDEESSIGYGNKIEEILSLPKEVLFSKGKEAKKFVINNKNYRIQSKRIIDLISH